MARIVDLLLPAALRPVGEPVETGSGEWRSSADIEPIYYRSGTAALAAVFAGYVDAAKMDSKPEILMPAYTCPDVVSAIAAAGAKARLVEMLPGRPWLDIDALADSLNERSLALVAINFQGIDEQLGPLRAWCDSVGLPLIYDHCQAFPATDEAIELSDVLVFSFGRGKPACALVGGSVWINSQRSDLDLPRPAGTAGGVSFLKRLAYNWLIKPRLYGSILRIPGLGIGETTFHPLERIEGLNSEGVSQVLAAIDSHLSLEGYAYRQQLISAQIGQIAGWEDLPVLCNAPKTRPLLRYTVLAPNAETRDRQLERLRAKGLGATGMYPKPVGKIDGVSQYLANVPHHPQAEDFSNRVMTLPCHSDVSASHIDKIAQLLASC